MTFHKSSNGPSHHPGPELLMDYAAGSLPEPVALLVATHASLCRACQAEIARLDALGGALFDSLDGEPLTAESMDRALARLETCGEPDQEPRLPAPCAADARLPRPLRDYLSEGMATLSWKSLGGAVSEAALLPDYPGIKTRLLRIKGGTAMPQHTHEGREYTLLLAGGFSDESGHYLRGDVAEADPSVDHRPVADAGEDCLCLAVTDAPLRLTGPFGRYLNIFARERL